MIPRLFLISIIGSALGGLAGCDDAATADAGTPAIKDSGADASPNCPLDCAGHGTCFIENGLPDCRCDDGFEAQGLSCVDSAGTAAPPADFSCPSPGDLTGPWASRLVSSPWSYRANDRSCEPSGASLYRFRADGVFSRGHQSRTARPGVGTLVYGCYTVTEDAEGVLALNYGYAEDNPWQFNCGIIGALDDEPCAGALKYDAERDGFVSQRQLEYGEVHLLSPAPDDCAWCNDRDGCCAPFGWVEIEGAAVCPQ